MKHVCMLLLQVIHLWFEEFALEDTELCTADFITLGDTVGDIGKYFFLPKQVERVIEQIYLPVCWKAMQSTPALLLSCSFPTVLSTASEMNFCFVRGNFQLV